MNKVTIDRELLERELLSVLDFSESNLRRVVDHLIDVGYTRAAPRQPEGDGLEVVDKIGTFEIPDIVATFDGLYLIPVKPLNAGDHLMAISQHRRMWQDAQRAIAELDRKVWEWSSAATAEAHRVDELKAERDTLRQQLAELRDRLDVMTQCADNYSRMFEESAEECEHLKACQENDMLHMTGLVAERDTLRQQLVERDEEIERLQVFNKSLDDEAAERLQDVTEAENEAYTLRQQLAELRDMLSGEVETNIPLRQKAFDLTEQRDKLAEILRDIVPGCKWKHMRPRIDAALAEIDHDNE